MIWERNEDRLLLLRPLHSKDPGDFSVVGCAVVYERREGGGEPARGRDGKGRVLRSEGWVHYLDSAWDGPEQTERQERWVSTREWNRVLSILLLNYYAQKS